MKDGKLKQWAASLKSNTFALYLASKDKRVPVSVKLLIGFLVAYALSPIDLIPDFIPVIGYLDDLVILPIGIWFVLRLIPREVWEDCLNRVKSQEIKLGQNRIAAAVIVLIWISLLSVFGFWLLDIFQNWKKTC